MEAYFFDLDGTLTDSRQGLYTSFRAALTALGLADIDDRELAHFLGTPLPEMFRKLKPGIIQSEIEHGITAFRVAYERDGVYQNHLYDGVLDILREIANQGRKSWIVTSKPQPYAVRVVQALGLKPHVSGVIGAGLDEKDTKADLIGQALELSGLENWQVVMIGDRHYDVEGALENRIRPIGVLWGYGSKAELHRAGCTDFARTPTEFIKKYVEIQPTGLRPQELAQRYAVVR